MDIADETKKNQENQVKNQRNTADGPSVDEKQN
jgi:hypothetical protein